MEEYSCTMIMCPDRRHACISVKPWLQTDEKCLVVNAGVAYSIRKDAGCAANAGCHC